MATAVVTALGLPCPWMNCGEGDAERTGKELEEEDDEELDETLPKRLWGLMAMFPEDPVHSRDTFDLSLIMVQKMNRFSRTILWIGTTSP